MARKYPKYVKETGNTLGYQRAVPTRLQHIAKKRLYSYPLGLSFSASEAQIHRALADADEAFRLFCKTAEFSSPSSICYVYRGGSQDARSLETKALPSSYRKYRLSNRLSPPFC